ncbi:MAG: hypothetical protein ACREQ8_03560 [Woeseiaceae bacterium]
MTRGKGPDSLLIADGGQNSLVQITLSEPSKTLLHFPQVPNPQGVLPPFTDAVPTSARHFKGNQFVVTTFGGVPFAEGTASVRLVDTKARTESELIPDLTAVSDVLALGSELYVLQLFSGDCCASRIRRGNRCRSPRGFWASLRWSTRPGTARSTSPSCSEDRSRASIRRVCHHAMVDRAARKSVLL